jgi:hypothetical protein
MAARSLPRWKPCSDSGIPENLAMIPYLKAAEFVVVTGAGALAAVEWLCVDPLTDDVRCTRFNDCLFVNAEKYARIMRKIASNTGRPSIIAPMKKGRAMAMIAVADLQVVAPDQTGPVWLIPRDQEALSVCLPVTPMNPSRFPVGANPGRCLKRNKTSGQTMPDGSRFNSGQWDAQPVSPRHQVALDLAEQGIPVFPLQPGTKKPLKGRAGFKDATTDPDQVTSLSCGSPSSEVNISKPQFIPIGVAARLCGCSVATGYRHAMKSFYGQLVPLPPTFRDRWAIAVAEFEARQGKFPARRYLEEAKRLAEQQSRRGRRTVLLY